MGDRQEKECRQEECRQKKVQAGEGVQAGMEGRRGAGYRNLTSPSLPLSFADIFHAVTAFPSCEHRWKKPPVCAAETLTNSRCSYPAAASPTWWGSRGGGAPGSPGPREPTPVPAAPGRHLPPAEVQPCPGSPRQRLPVPAPALAALPPPCRLSLA